MIAPRAVYLAVLLCGSFANAADVRYNVLHLQQAYGEDLFFRGLSHGGILTAASVDGLWHIADGSATVIPFPFPAGDAQYTDFGDSGVAYAATLGPFPDRELTGVHIIGADGSVTDTGYVPRGTSLFLGRQNSLGAVVGDEEGGDIPASAGFLYTPGTGAQSFETLGGVSVGRFSAINDSGWIVGLGVGTTAQGEVLVDGAVLWIPGQPALELRRGSDSPVAINNAGQIVGRDGSRAWFWDAGVFQFISDYLVADPANPAIVRNATSFAGAAGINSGGLVVGSAVLRFVPGFTPTLDQYGWIWSEDGGLELLQDLIDPSLGFGIESGFAIDDRGNILAAGHIEGLSGVQHFLLTPIPEPGAGALLLLAACLPVHLRRRR